MKKIDGRLHIVGKSPSFTCEICGKSAREKYILWPHQAIVNLLPENYRKSRNVCKQCARREIGPRKWKQLLEQE